MRIKIYVDGSAAQVVASPHPLTKGMVGIECELDYSSEWSGLIRNACARATKGATVVAERTVLGITDTFTVPHEALAAAGCKLEIGIEGRKSDGTVVIPTEWAYVGRVIQGVEDNASETTPPTPSQLTQLQAAINAKPSQSYVDNALADKADADDLDVLTETVAGLDNDLEETTAALAGKANTVHQHQVSDVTGLQTALDAKQKKLTAGQNITIAEDGTISATGGGSGSTAWSDITGKPETFTPAEHTHSITDVTDLETRLDGIDANITELVEAVDGAVTDVKVNGTSCVTDGVASIPVADGSNLGVCKFDYQYSFMKTAENVTYLSHASTTQNRSASTAKYKAISAGNIDAFVRLCLCDGTGPEWTETEQAAARARLGISIWDGSVSET